MRLTGNFVVATGSRRLGQHRHDAVPRATRGNRVSTGCRCNDVRGAVEECCQRNGREHHKADNFDWIGTWGASPQFTTGDNIGPAPPLNNQTIREIAIRNLLAHRRGASACRRASKGKVRADSPPRRGSPLSGAAARSWCLRLPGASGTGALDLHADLKPLVARPSSRTTGALRATPENIGEAAMRPTSSEADRAYPSIHSVSFSTRKSVSQAASGRRRVSSGFGGQGLRGCC
jgi:hypothetical protein